VNVLYKQAMKTINAYVEEREGNWKEVRKDVLRDIDLLFINGSIGAKSLAYVLDDVYRELAPPQACKEVPKL